MGWPGINGGFHERTSGQMARRAGHGAPRGGGHLVSVLEDLVACSFLSFILPSLPLRALSLSSSSSSTIFFISRLFAHLQVFLRQEIYPSRGPTLRSAAVKILWGGGTQKRPLANTAAIKELETGNKLSSGTMLSCPEAELKGFHLKEARTSTHVCVHARLLLRCMS